MNAAAPIAKANRIKAEGVVKAIGAGVNEWQAAEKLARAGDFDLFLLAGRYFEKAVGGITGDLLGAVEQLSEIAAWLILLTCRQL